MALAAVPDRVMERWVAPDELWVMDRRVAPDKLWAEETGPRAAPDQSVSEVSGAVALKPKQVSRGDWWRGVQKASGFQENSSISVKIDQFSFSGFPIFSLHRRVTSKF
jgi:hypothetical protein